MDFELLPAAAETACSGNAAVAGFAGEDVERRATDGVPRSAASLGEDAGDDGRRRQESVVVQAMDRAVGQVRRTAGQPGFDERVRCYRHIV